MQYFLAVAEHASFAEAARALGMSQPPLSQGIQRLERHLGTRLFERRGGVRLTPDGDALRERATALVEAAAAITAIGAGSSPRLTVGVVPQIPARHVARALTVLRGAGAAQPHVVTAGSVELVDRVESADIDLAVVVHPVPIARVRAESTILTLPTWAVVPSSVPSPRAARAPFRLDALAPLPLSTAPRAHNPAAYDLVRDTARASGLTLAPTPVADDRDAVLAVASGQCAALTADRSLRGPGQRLVELAGAPLPLRLRLVWSEPAEASAGPELRSALMGSLREDGR